jgi:hypothetical protein
MVSNAAALPASVLCIVHPIPSRPAAALPGPVFCRPDLPARSRSGFASAKAGRSRLQGGSVEVRGKRPAKLAKFKKAEDSMASPVFAGLAKSGEIHANQRLSIRSYATAPWIVGRLPRHRYDLCRKPRKLRKPPPTMTAVHAVDPRRAASRTAYCRSCRVLSDSVRSLPVPEGSAASMSCGHFPRCRANAILFPPAALASSGAQAPDRLMIMPG